MSQIIERTEAHYDTVVNSICTHIR
jgi:hypothetical protein